MTNSCTCKAEHWQPHKADCPAYKPPVAPTSSVATLRLLAKCGSMDLSALGAIADEMERMQAEVLTLRQANISLAMRDAVEPGAALIVGPDQVSVACPRCKLDFVAHRKPADGRIPTDGQLMDQLEAAFEKMNDGYVELDLQLRRELADNLVRFNRPPSKSGEQS